MAVAYNKFADKGVALWDGNTWTSLGGVFDPYPTEVIVFNGELHAAGGFTSIGGSPISFVAKWNGNNWVQVGTPLNARVQALAVHNGSLFIGGDFTSSNGTPLEHVARLDGSAWAPVGSGLNNNVEDLRSVGTELWLVGRFTFDADSTIQLANSARWDGNQFAPLSDTPLASNSRRILHANDYGYIVSDQARSVVDPGPNERPLNMRGLRAISVFNGQTLVGGVFTHYAHREVKNIARLLPGLDTYQLNKAGMNIRVNAWGGVGYDLDLSMPGFEVPAGSGRSSLFAQGICAVAVSGSDLFVIPNLFTAQFPYAPTPGPWSDDTTAIYWDRYTQVWPVDNGAVWDHNAQWNQPGYFPSYSISDWPGNGDVTNGEPQDLAPYSDQDGNGAYSALAGDIPMFRGDAAVYQVASDQRSPAWQGLPPMALDIHTMTYAYDVAPGDLRYQVLFKHHTLINRSTNTYDTLWMASWADIDLGCPLDDYVGCDTLLNLAFGYNGDPNDEDCSGFSGYGSPPPAQGIMPLNSTVRAFLSVNYTSTSGAHSPSGYYHAVQGLSPNGTPIVNPFTGTVTPFMYPTDPNDPNGWSEITSLNAPGDRRLLVSYGPWYNVAPGDTVCLDLALVFAQDTLGDNLSSVTLLKQRAAAVKAWYDQQTLGCGEYIALDVAEPGVTTSPSPLLFPNPTSDRLTVRRIPDGVEKLLVLDLLGRPVSRLRVVPGAVDMQLDLSTLAPGSYLVSFTGSVKVPAQRVLVVR
ncbi:MAG: hypothetical protein R2810_15170 [Flavobacteriales bacterium]